MAEKKILIADYDEPSLDLYLKLLKSQKYQIILTTDGQMAYEKFLSEKPDLVILEAMLPKFHGFDLALKISEDSEGKVPVIIVTSLYRGPQFKNEAITTYRVVDFFEKPFEPDKFLRRVNEFLQDDFEMEEGLPDSVKIIEALARSLQES